MNYMVVGGAGFIGSYVVDYLLSTSRDLNVTVYDNFSAGKRWHLEKHINDRRMRVIPRDIYDPEILDAISGADVTVMLAANPDIAKAAFEPDIDFRQGTALIQIVLEAMRKGGCRRLLYSSGSGVYGDTGMQWVGESFSPMEPISTYGASKLACEALISSYCHMFELKASIFRFGNVVGGRQTHGVAYDFIKRLRKNPLQLEVLGDGTQSKPYIHVTEVIDAMFLVLNLQKKSFEIFNVAPNDFITVKEIANIVCEKMNFKPSECEIVFGQGNRGWKGDVPIVRLKTDKIRSLGWSNRLSSRDAIIKSVEEMIKNSDLMYKDE